MKNRVRAAVVAFTVAGLVGAVPAASATTKHVSGGASVYDANGSTDYSVSAVRSASVNPQDAHPCSYDVCLDVFSRGGSGTFITRVRVYLSSGFLTGSNSTVEYYQRYESGASYTNVLRGSAFPPWNSFVSGGVTYQPYAYNFYPNRYFKNHSYICGAITGHSGFPCAEVHS